MSMPLIVRTHRHGRHGVFPLPARTEAVSSLGSPGAGSLSRSSSPSCSATSSSTASSKDSSAASAPRLTKNSLRLWGPNESCMICNTSPISSAVRSRVYTGGSKYRAAASSSAIFFSTLSRALLATAHTKSVVNAGRRASWMLRSMAFNLSLTPMSSSKERLCSMRILLAATRADSDFPACAILINVSTPVNRGFSRVPWEAAAGPCRRALWLWHRWQLAGHRLATSISSMLSGSR